MSILRELLDLGQSIWFDNISRGMILTGDLKRKVGEGLTGVTSNPTIFEKAISGSSDYEQALKNMFGRSPSPTTGEIIQELMIDDIRDATDILRSVYDQSNGHDGFVSIEVTPSKARDTKATIEEVRFLWKRVSRPNLMVKIPATLEGLPAIEQMLSEGININITLIFSVERYRAVALAYLNALERRAAEHKPLDRVASVASVFVSRVDTLVDGMLAKLPAEKAAPLLGTAAVANTKMVYQAFKEIFLSERFASLAGKGAQVQRPLWGSTGTKNPAYSDLKYVEPLIGANTVNTVPPQTYAAILDHGTARAAIEDGFAEARQKLDMLKEAGIDMKWVTKKLEEEGVAAFEKSFDGLSQFLEEKRAAAFV
ncbi:MAG: transaldolase [Bacteroidota bacterium]